MEKREIPAMKLAIVLRYISGGNCYVVGVALKALKKIYKLAERGGMYVRVMSGGAI
jgi:hypothetical protein